MTDDALTSWVYSSPPVTVSGGGGGVGGCAGATITFGTGVYPDKEQKMKCPICKEGIKLIESYTEFYKDGVMKRNWEIKTYRCGTTTIEGDPPKYVSRKTTISRNCAEIEC